MNRAIRDSKIKNYVVLWAKALAYIKVIDYMDFFFRLKEIKTGPWEQKRKHVAHKNTVRERDRQT